MLERLRTKAFQVRFVSHAEAIMRVDFPEAIEDLDQVLDGLSISVEELVRSGGGEAKLTQRLRKAFAARGWTKRKFVIKKLINEVPRQSISHEVDHVRALVNGCVALEVEWNNKDPFFDRDLENFKRLHAEGAISVGVILTRSELLQDRMPALIKEFARQRNIHSFDDLKQFGHRTPRQVDEVLKRTRSGRVPFGEAWSAQFCADKFGQATTHWRKLTDRVDRGVGNPCPLLVIGIPPAVITA